MVKRFKAVRRMAKPRRAKASKKYVQKIVKKELHKQIETKQVDFISDIININTNYNTGGFDLLTNLHQSIGQQIGGLTNPNRVLNQGFQGLQLRAQRITITGTILNNTAAAGGFNDGMIRLMVVEDLQATNSDALQLYNGSDYFSNNIYIANIFNSPTLPGKKRFRILAQKYFNMSSNRSNWAKFKFSIDLKNSLYQYYPYTGATGQMIGEMNKGLHLYATCLMSDNTHPPTLYYYSQFKFEDA